MVPINYLAVLASTIMMMVLGFLWYGPIFGKQWQSLMGFTAEDMNEAKAKGMVKTYAIMALGALVMSFVLAHSLIFASNYMKVTGVVAGLEVGIWNWLGFIVPVSIGSVLWDGKPWKYWVITYGYNLVGMLTMAAILGAWM